MNADERGFILIYLRQSALICGSYKIWQEYSRDYNHH